jgi:hypothetical protein
MPESRQWIDFNSKNTRRVVMPDFVKQYKELEGCFKKQVIDDREELRCDDIVYLPTFIVPKRQADYIFIAMEPSLTTKWAGKSPRRKDGEAAVKEGYRNFVPGRRGFGILHYCATKYLCTGGQTYYITDMSKGAMPVVKANSNREERWDKWFPLLEKELKLVAKKDATVFAIGRRVERFLIQKRDQGKFDYRLKYLLHPANTAAGARKKYIAERQPEFDGFKQDVTEKDLVDFAARILSKEKTEWALQSKKRLKTNKMKELKDSPKMLIFCYKIKFEECR